MKKLFILLTMLLVGIGSSWAGYIPTKRVTTFESGKVYMLYNTCVTNSDTRTGFIYWDGGMKKNASFNPHQFATNNTAYLWRVTTGENNHIALQNVSTSKYIGFSLSGNDTDPNNLFMYQWGEWTAKQAGVKSQNEDDPSQTTNNADITFANNKVYIIGNGNDTFWNGNSGDIVTWSTGHPFAFYEVEECALDRADVGTYRFQTTALTTGASGYSISKDGSGNVTISPNSGGSYGATSGRFLGTLVVRINVPSTTTAGILCDLRPASDDIQAAQGLYMNTGCKLQTSWGYNGSITPRTDGNTLTTGEHTIIYTTGEEGAKVYVDGTQKLTDGGLKASGVSYKAIYIPAAYAQYVTEVYFYSANVCADYSSLISAECANYMHASQITGTTAEVASDKTLILDTNKDWTSLTGTGTVLQESDAITTNVAGDLPALTLKATAGTLNYTGNNLAGTTLDGVVLASTTARVTTSGTVNIKNLAGCNLPNPSGNYGYAFVGSGTINFYGTCDLTKKSDGTTDALSSNLGYGSSATIVVKENATLKAGVIFNTRQSENNASITVENGGTLTTIGWTHDDGVIYANNLVNNGTINISTGRYQTGYGISTIHNTLSGSGTLNIAEGSNFNVASIPSTSTLTGAGNIILTNFPTSTAPTLSSWTGTVQFPATETYQDNLTALFNAWGNTGSTIKLNSVGGKFYQSETVNPTLNILSGATLSIGNASSDYTPVLTGVGGAGTLNFASGATISVPSIPNTLTLTGAGVIKLTTFPTSSAPTLSSWTGTVQFPDINSASNITDIFNAWGNANSTINLNNLSGHFSNNENPVQPTLNILSGKTLTINNGCSDYPPVLSKLTGKGDLNISWNDSRDPYKLTVQKLEDFSGTLSTVKAPIVVEKLVCANPPYVNTRLIKTTGTVTLEKLYIGLERTTAYTWETKTVEDVEGIYVSALDQVQRNRETAIALVTPYYNGGYVGTGLGKYIISLGETSYSNLVDFGTAVMSWQTLEDCVEPTIAINQPAEGFYRFKAAARSAKDNPKNWYMGGNASSIYSASTTEAQASDANTIFYLENDEDGYHLLSYFSGMYSNGTQYNEIGTKSNFTLSEGIKENKTDKLIGQYRLYNTGTSKIIAMWENDYLNALTNENDWEGWTIEPVDELPVTFKKAGLGYATFCSPVAVKVPEGVIALVSKIKDNTISLYKIDKIKDENNNIIIPARTPVMLYKSGVSENTDVLFPISDYSGDKITEDFYGTIATETMKSGYTYYSLRAWKAYDSEETSKVGFVLKDSGNLTGFRAWIEIPGTAGARDFTIVFDGDEAPTGIVEALGLENDNVDIYDLNGRKLSSYRKGINIVNGKKVMVQ